MSLPLSLMWRATIAENPRASGDAEGEEKWHYVTMRAVSRRLRIVLTAAIVLYAAVLVRYTCYVAGGADSSGYLNAARMLAQRQLSVRVAPLDTMHLDNSWRDVFTPLGFASAPTPRNVGPSYPLGYPLLLVLPGVIFGWKRAPFLVTPLAAILSVVLTYRVARRLGLDRWYSIAAAALLAVSPPFLFLG